MEKKLTYDEIEKVFGILPHQLDRWISKGFIEGTPDGIQPASLEEFLQDIGYHDNSTRFQAMGKVGAAYRQFVNTWPDMLGPEMSGMLRDCIEGEDITLVASRYSISVSTLQYYIRSASIRLRRYYEDVPNLRHRLAEALQENRRMFILLKKKEQRVEEHRDLVKEKICDTLKESFGYSEKDLDKVYTDLMHMLHTSVTEMGLSVRCKNAAVKSGVNTLFDFIVVNKACGKSGMLTKLPHFGMRSYQEVEGLLTRLNLIRVDRRGNWQSVVDFLIDPESELYIRYSGNPVAGTTRKRLRGNELVAEWIGNYMAFTHDRKQNKIG